VDVYIFVPMETGINTLHSSYKIYNFILTMTSIAAMLSEFRMTVTDRFQTSCSAFNRTGCAQLSHKVVHCLSFKLLLFWNSLINFRAENFLYSRRFWWKLCYAQSEHCSV